MSSAPGRWRMVFAASSLVAIGAASGITADRLLHRRTTTVSIHEMSNEGRLDALDAEVALRPDQRARIAEIMESHQPTIDRAWSEARARLDTSVDRVISEIEQVLDSTQVVRYRELVKRVHGEGRHQ